MIFAYDVKIYTQVNFQVANNLPIYYSMNRCSIMWCELNQLPEKVILYSKLLTTIT